MECNNIITRLLGIKGWEVKGLSIEDRKGTESVIVDLGRTEREHTCSKCGDKVDKAYTYKEQEARHLLWWSYPTYLRFTKYRVKCHRCGKKVEKLNWLKWYGRVTNGLASLVGELCKVMTVEAVALLLYLHRGTVKELDKRAIKEAQKNRSLEGITALGVDEMAVGKGHKYWHMVHTLDGPNGPELLYIGEGRKEKDLKGFWRWFGKRRAKKIFYAVMDMWKGFEKSFKANCPKVKIIYDKFHIVRHLLNALNEVRKAEFRIANKQMKGHLIGKKFILLSRMENLMGDARKALKQLLRVNRRLYKAYLLKESFGQLWSYTSKTWAMKFWNNWKEQLKWSRLTPYKKFAKMIDRHMDGILSYCEVKLPLGYIEAANLKAKNIIRRAYGYRDKEYMKLKIIQGCSSLGGFNPWNTPSNIPS